MRQSTSSINSFTFVLTRREKWGKPDKNEGFFNISKFSCSETVKAIAKKSDLSQWKTAWIKVFWPNSFGDAAWEQAGKGKARRCRRQSHNWQTWTGRTSHPAGLQLCPSPPPQPSRRSAVFKALQPLESRGFTRPLTGRRSLPSHQPRKSLLGQGGGV